MSIERPKAENASLRAQLHARPGDHATLENGKMLSSPAPSSQDTGSINMVPAAQYEALARQHAELQASHAALKGQHEFMRKKWKESKTLVKQWQIYIKQKKDKDGNQGGPPEMSSSPPRLMAVPARTASQLEAQMPSQPTEKATSSQITVDDPQTQWDVPLLAQGAPSSDFEPVVVSTRCLKRKGAEGGLASPVRRIKQEPGSPSMPIEFRSSSPRRTPAFIVDTNSSDDCLDNFGPAMLTPRRPKRVSDLRLRATFEEVHRPAPLRRSASFLSDGDTGALSEQSMLYGPGDDDARETESLTEMETDSRPTPLKPISGNISRLQRAPEGQSKPRTKVRRTGARDKVLLVSEDGDDGFSQKTRLSPGLPADGRLDDLLNGLSPDRAPVLPRLVAAAEISTRNQGRAASAQLRTPVSVIKRSSPVKPTNGLGRTPVRAKSPQSWKRNSVVSRAAGLVATGKSPPPVRLEEEPLRIRLAASLRLEDFKINPKYMGTDFAFADTIRGRDARQNLHACTRADCCGGALAKVIQMGGTAMSGRTDAHALEAYIGPAWQELMGARKHDEAKQLLQQAHAFCFANEHGKHRQAFERRSTPPGYWRADFPTTQEQVIDRKTADEMQRKEVEDRHREAMRDGGRWIFRDE